LPLQRLVHALALTFPGDSSQRCASAIDIVQTLIQCKVPALISSPMALDLQKQQSMHDLTYVPHEYMSENWNPLCVTDVRKAMRGLGLDPVGAARFMDNFDSFVLSQTAHDTLAAIGDSDARELVRDFFINQSFRRDVFVRRGRTLDENERRLRLLKSSFALTRPADRVDYVCETPAGHLRYQNATARNIVDALACGPRSLISICEELSLGPETALANAVVLSVAETIRPVESCEFSISSLNRAVAKRLGGSEEIPFLAFPCGTALSINDDLRSLIAGGREEDYDYSWRDFLTAYNVLPSLRSYEEVVQEGNVD
jgi:hypothetical protein